MKRKQNLEIKKVEEKIAEAIIGSEFEKHVFLVGGIIRDELLNRLNNDMDIVVDLPNGGIRLAKFLHKKKISSYPVIFERFGTSMIIIDHHNVELVMTRKEFYFNNSRKPEVEVGSLEDDAIRRDFTINALYRRVNDNKILDLTGKGISDLQNKLLRTTNDPVLVFTEDPLRMMRAVRFAAQLDFRIDDSAWDAILQEHQKLQNISSERIRDELQKIILSPNPTLGFQLLKKTKLLSQIIQPLSMLDEVSWNNLINKLSYAPKKIDFRLALICSAIQNYDYIKILHDLRFSKIEQKKIKSLLENSKILNSDAWKEFSDADWRHWILQSKHSHNNLLEFAFINCDLEESKKKIIFSEIKKRLNNIEMPETTFPIDGNIIKKTFPKIKGKGIGEFLNRAYRIWLEDPNQSKEEIISKIKH